MYVCMHMCVYMNSGRMANRTAFCMTICKKFDGPLYFSMLLRTLSGVEVLLDFAIQAVEVRATHFLTP